jgi:hypothetical protein
VLPDPLDPGIVAPAVPVQVPVRRVCSPQFVRIWQST